MNAPQPDSQVLVVGAGPTGLVLAADLLARGIRTRVIDQGDGVALQARAIGIHARTLEVLDTMGLADRFTERGQVVRQLRFYSRGRCLTSLEFARCGSRFGYVLDLPQDQTERLLRARVAELGGAIEQRTELTSLTPGTGVVTAAVRRPGGQTEAITAGYVVGCDGAHSRVRRELGLTFDGQAYPQDWLLADVLLDGDLPARGLPEDAIHAFFRPDGLPLILFPMRGHRWRLTVPFAGDRGDQAPTLAEIQHLTSQRAPRPVTVSDPTWLAVFRCHRRSASACRRGRVLLAGDAVHIHTPAGGQGLNAGMLDAHNLGWKLALVASGRAPDALLDSYGAERRPVAEEVLRLTHALVHYGTMSHPVKRRVRDVVVPRPRPQRGDPAPGRPPDQPDLRELSTRRAAHARHQRPGRRPGRHAAPGPARRPARAGGPRSQLAHRAGRASALPGRSRRRHRTGHRAGRTGPAGRPRGRAGQARPHARGDRLPARAVRRAGFSPGRAAGPGRACARPAVRTRPATRRAPPRRCRTSAGPGCRTRRLPPAS
jgi:2-polyprenyl-6-methoxyphenol hydroxylase-like FAD-dependent oxidoreductase